MRGLSPGWLLGVVLLAGCHAPQDAPARLSDQLAGDWDITVRMRESETGAWQEFRTTARIDWLVDQGLLRERPLDATQPWRELAFTRWDGASGQWVFEHLFSGSLSMLQMRGRYDAATGTIRYAGQWHRQRGEEVRREPASGTLTIESDDRHLWRLDKIGEDGSSFVDLEMVYERREDRGAGRLVPEGDGP